MMKITTIYVYPIKALRGISLQSAMIGPQGIMFDRSFMLFQIQEDGNLRKMQHSSFPQVALFSQTFLPAGSGERPNECTAVQVRYHPPPTKSQDDTTVSEEDNETLDVPLHPDISKLSPVDVDLHKSPTTAYRMGEPYDAWFTSRFGFPVALVFIGDGRRPVLGKSLHPPQPTPNPTPEQKSSWLSTISSYLPGQSSNDPKETPWITFTDVAPLLITSTSSLHNVSSRLPPSTPMPMYKFRPNLVVDGQDEPAFAEDFWTELLVTPAPRPHLPPEDRTSFSSSDSAELNDGEKEEEAKKREERKEMMRWRLLLTGNCGRCTSLNVDYDTGKQAEGELGTVLKKLMVDRRVDRGAKWSPIFGRYAFLGDVGGYWDEIGGVVVQVGDEVEVLERSGERSVWDWPGLGST
ncbi:hypothetical protein QBC34DRAFT_499022 [Podospora aff. communis PSN243]|uniref:MOSC domain-containing protein n=1 Tax=Podospora aff. communis PSN243 TaxID=3040156 RepID=A0AAV9G4H8_9PEZI|nr:hypothetical protein QBC34DRAFT_499022 [Podospora aff. communis PSN243]